MLSRRTFLLGCMGAAVVSSQAAYSSAFYEPADLGVVRRTILIRDLPARLAAFRTLHGYAPPMTTAGSITDREAAVVRSA